MTIIINLQSMVPEWLTIVKNQDGDILRVNKNFHFANVIEKLN